MDDINKMIKKFNRSIDFSDKPTGFFGFLRDTFVQLARRRKLLHDGRVWKRWTIRHSDIKTIHMNPS